MFDIEAMAPDVVEVAIGHWHYCARHDDGELSCWGDSFFGQVGDGTNDFRHDPTSIWP